jgi:hypothetical protein
MPAHACANLCPQSRQRQAHITPPQAPHCDLAVATQPWVRRAAAAQQGGVPAAAGGAPALVRLGARVQRERVARHEVARARRAVEGAVRRQVLVELRPAADPSQTLSVRRGRSSPGSALRPHPDLALLCMSQCPETSCACVAARHVRVSSTKQRRAPGLAEATPPHTCVCCNQLPKAPFTSYLLTWLAGSVPAGPAASARKRHCLRRSPGGTSTRAVREQQRDEPRPELLDRSASGAPVGCAHRPQPRAVRLCEQLTLVALLVHVVPHLPAIAPVTHWRQGTSLLLVAF